MWTGKLHRYVAVFQKGGDEMVDKIQLSPAEFEAIRRLLNYDKSDPMYDCYPLTDDVLRSVSSILGGKLCLGDYDYLLEAEGEATPPPGRNVKQA